MNDANEIINRIETFLRQQTELYSDVNFDLIDSVPTATAETIPVSLADRVNAVSSPGPEDRLPGGDRLAQWLALLPALLVWGLALISEPLLLWLGGLGR